MCQRRCATGTVVSYAAACAVEIDDYRVQLKQLYAQANSALLAACGVGCETAAVLSDHPRGPPDRLRTKRP